MERLLISIHHLFFVLSFFFLLLSLALALAYSKPLGFQAFRTVLHSLIVVSLIGLSSNL